MHGIQHTTSHPGRLREALNLAWEAGQSVSGHAWNALRYEIEELATQADEAGWAAGVPFTDSKGMRQLELVDIALTFYKKYKAEAEAAA